MKEQEAQAKLSLKLQAYQYLKTKILNCEYRPNEFLNEQKLCAEMGNISRTPMRDALGRLEQEGLITISSSSCSASLYPGCNPTTLSNTLFHIRAFFTRLFT